MTKRTITILQLYPRDMNIYGDTGNVLVLKKRLEWSGYEVSLIEYNQGDIFPQNIDIITGGGGQDSGQNNIQADLIKIGPRLIELANQDLPMIMICGMYQLFGKYFKTNDGQIINGIGLLDIETNAGDERLVGNVLTESKLFGSIIAYENHSGRTKLGESAKPLGKIIKGAGNNGYDKTEGVHYRNVIASYLHGPLLAKNPKIADYLIQKSIERKYGKAPDLSIESLYEKEARNYAIKRPR